MNLGEEIIERYENSWFIQDTGMMVATRIGNNIVQDTRYIQFQNYWDGWFEVAVLNWNMSSLSFRKIDKVSKFSKLSIVENAEMIEKLNKTKKRQIIKKSIRTGKLLITKRFKLDTVKL